MALLLESEPAPGPNGPQACFTSATAKTDSKEPLDLARAALALADRPHRAALATTLAQELARVTRAGALAEPAFDGTRAERAIVHAALARFATGWSKDASTGRRYVQGLSSLRDARGGYGSTEATRDVVRTLVALDETAGATREPARITVLDGKTRSVVDLAPRSTAVVPLGKGTRSVELEVTGGPVVARLERPALRSFTAAPDQTIAPVTVAVAWPNDAVVGSTGIVHVTYTATLGRNVTVTTRMPLPPGVELAAPVDKVTLRQGVVHVALTLNAAETLTLPVRFTLPGKMMVPEAETRTTSEDQPRSLSPARALVVR